MKTIANIIHHKTSPLNILDDYGNTIYYESISEFWMKREYADNGDEIYYETSTGYILDNRE